MKVYVAVVGTDSYGSALALFVPMPNQAFTALVLLQLQVIATAHSHQAYVCSIEGRTVTQGASYGRLVTDITLDFGTNGVTSKAHIVVIDNTEAIGTPAERAALEALIERARTETTFALVLAGSTTAQVETFNPDGVLEAPAILEGSLV